MKPDQIARLRSALQSVGVTDLTNHLMDKCSAQIKASDLLEHDEGRVARFAAYRAGYEEAIKNLFAISIPKNTEEESGHAPM